MFRHYRHLRELTPNFIKTYGNNYVVYNKRISSAITPYVSRSSGHITEILYGVARNRGVSSERYERHFTSKV
jgi:hypothetical protein